MKGIMAAITITLAIISASVAVLGELSSRGMHFEKDMTPQRQQAQIQFIKTMSALGAERFDPYQLGDNKYQNQTAALNLFALIMALPVLILAPLVFLKRLTQQNRVIAICSFGLAAFAIVLPFNLSAALAIFFAQWCVSTWLSFKVRQSPQAA